jgi:predicted RNA methylase
MSQLSFWNHLPDPESTGTAQEETVPGPTIPVENTAKQPNKATLKCLFAADALQKHIDAKHSSANNMLAQPPTRKRLSDADAFRREAIRLERVQETLRRLADLHEAGSMNPELANLTSRGAIESALFTAPQDSAIRVLYDSVTRDENREERVLRLTREAALIGIPGYFATPNEVADYVLAIARIEAGNTICEPSAGTGSLIDAVRKHHPQAKVSYCELNCFLLDILRDKYEGVEGVSFLGRDFLEVDQHRVGKGFDRIIMNPPFERGEDADHVQHAYRLLTPGGILTAIVSAGVLSRSDRKSKTFREFLDSHQALVKNVPSGAFKSSGTGVETKIVCVQSRCQ